MRFSFALGCGFAVSLGLALPAMAQGNSLKPFSTDGCSMWIDGTPAHPYLWRHCCVAHDKAYWIGGSAQQHADADGALQACVTTAIGAGMGDSMYMGVIMGGSPIWLTPYRWGYGWNYLEEGKLRGYKSLTDEAQAQVAELLPQAEQIIAQDAIKHPAESTALTGR